MSRTNKYGAHKVRTPDGIFDSQLEYQRWLELILLQRAGKITRLRRQVPFELIPRQTEEVRRISKITGKPLKPGTRTVEQACSYKADFVYEDQSGNLVVEDTKGLKTKEYIIKRKLMLYKYGIRIREVQSNA